MFSLNFNLIQSIYLKPVLKLLSHESGSDTFFLFVPNDPTSTNNTQTNRKDKLKPSLL